jgi:hypothetical protein
MIVKGTKSHIPFRYNQHDVVLLEKGPLPGGKDITVVQTGE